MDFEWDDAKEKANIEKHDLNFDDALQIFTDDNLYYHCRLSFRLW